MASISLCPLSRPEDDDPSGESSEDSSKSGSSDSMDGQADFCMSLEKDIEAGAADEMDLSDYHISLNLHDGNW